jgi:CheY-like chemotaxis protein
VLAGGIAHDFNNLLTGVIGNAGLVMESMPVWDVNRPAMTGLLESAQRAASLTRQLLAYAGKGRFWIERLDISQSVRDMSDLLRASVPSSIAIDQDFQEKIAAVEGDTGQIEQIVMNLVLNASEAIGERPGHIRIRTGTRSVDEAMIAECGWTIPAGTYVYLEVHDDGSGMDHATQARIFAPFYTTKFMGRGLGLAAVHGIVQKHAGVIHVYSRPGLGSVFTVLFPAVAAGASAKAEVTEDPRDLSGKGTVLVVDDEETVRAVATATLERHGYRVMTATNGVEALEVFGRSPNEISVVVLDMTMPLMGGEETLGKLKAMRADIPVLLSSGYNEPDVMRRFTGQGLAGFIGKPYSARDLLAKIRAVYPG